MESKWLEDFVSLAETGSFSRSASSRHVTQPAFSRRIRSLEAWLGADLIDRTSYPTRMPPAGALFYGQAVDAFLPQSAVAAEVRARKLACAGERWSVEMEIRLYREKPGPARPGKRAALAWWQHLAGLGKVMPKKHKTMKT